MGHRTSNDEMMRVPRDLADYVRSEAPKRGLTYMAFMREMVLVHLDAGDSAPAPKAKKTAKPKAKKAAAKKASDAGPPELTKILNVRRCLDDPDDGFKSA